MKGSQGSHTNLQNMIVVCPNTWSKSLYNHTIGCSGEQKRRTVHPLVSRKIYRKISIYLNFHAISKNSNSLKSGRTENSKGQRSVNDEYEYEFITITKHVREVEYIFPEKDDYTPENLEQKKGMLFVTK